MYATFYLYYYRIKRESDKWKNEAVEKRKIVNRLYFEKGFTKREIARQEEVSLGFVSKWTKSPDQNLTEDNRGWKKGRHGVHSNRTENRIEKIKKDLEDDPEEFFIGATAIQTEWRDRYPDEDPPPLRTRGQILKDLGLTEKTKEASSQGVAEYLNYPEHTIYQELGDRVLEADFVGEKYITLKSILRGITTTTFLGKIQQR